MPVLLDTGALYALADADDDWHVRIRDFLKAECQSLLVPATVIPEAACLMRKRLGAAAETRFAESLAADEIAVENLTPRDLARCAELLHIYDFLGFVDASAVAIADRLKVPALVTTDRRDFARVRPAHVPAFQLLPCSPGGAYPPRRNLHVCALLPRSPIPQARDRRHLRKLRRSVGPGLGVRHDPARRDAPARRARHVQLTPNVGNVTLP